MKQQEIEQIVDRQREYFSKGLTLPVENRLSALRSLRASLERHENLIFSALKADLCKSETETYMCELGMVYSELSYMLRNLKKFAAEKRTSTPLAQTVARSFVKPSPRGVTLIMSPWNYPLMLSLDPLIDALAAGNTVVLKPGSYAPATCEALKSIVTDAFDPGLVNIITGGREENRQLLEQKFDFIFFTGSQAVGKEVLLRAAVHFTPTVLELGGKSPCIVEKTANIKLTARRIAFGKFLNCGQTCVAPDYICCDRSIEEKLKDALKSEIIRQFGLAPLCNENYGKIINEKHFNRLNALLEKSAIFYGGDRDPRSLKIEPTILSPCSWSDEIMQEEIFGPLLPIIAYDSLNETLEKINSRPHPLALYIFSGNKPVIDRIKTICPFGGGCVNDTVIHLATPYMGFGGVGNSGMGAYHGKVGFDTFTHYKSIVDKKTWLDLPLRYQPYTDISQKLIRLFLK